MRENSVPKWNNRDLNAASRKDWEAFKPLWDDELKHNYERISINVGRNETELNFGWYSTVDEDPFIRYGTADQDESQYKEFKGSHMKHRTYNGITYYSNKVTITGLKRNSVYYYQRKYNDDWESAVEFKTYKSDNFSFIFLGDPQIGGSKGRYNPLLTERGVSAEEGIRNDAFNWNVTIIESINYTKEPSLILSAGDQAETMAEKDTIDDLILQEEEYSAFLFPKYMKSIPTAPTVGNHDQYSDNFIHHFNPPNLYESNLVLNNTGKRVNPGYNYFFKYNNVLVVVIDTNNNNCTDYSSVIDTAIETHPNTDWRIAMFHHDIYGNGSVHSGDKDINNFLRPCLTPLIHNAHFDLVINGHDHVYSSSKFITATFDDDLYAFEDIKNNTIYENHNGTLYITANCSTGSKLYTFSSIKNYTASYEQTFTSNFGLLDFEKVNGKVRLNITTFDVESKDIIDGPYILQKQAIITEEEENNDNDTVSE